MSQLFKAFPDELKTYNSVHITRVIR